MRRLLLATACCAVVAVLWSAPGAQARPCGSYYYTVPQFLRFARAVLPDPSARDALELRHIIHCQAWRPHQAQLRRWLRAHQNPPGWAIPTYIVMCESGGANLAPNGAGASGYYQIIPSTWAANGGYRYAPEAYMASKAAQDAVARAIWRSGGPSQWDCA